MIIQVQFVFNHFFSPQKRYFFQLSLFLNFNKMFKQCPAVVAILDLCLTHTNEIQTN